VTPQRAAELQTALEGIPLPAQKRDLIEYVRRQDPDGASELRALPEREYRAIDEVGEELLRVQPPQPNPDARLPRPESGGPPGGDAYTDPRPEPGQIRPSSPPDNPPQKQIEQQSKTQKDQQDKQKQLG